MGIPHLKMLEMGIESNVEIPDLDNFREFRESIVRNICVELKLGVCAPKYASFHQLQFAAKRMHLAIKASCGNYEQAEALMVKECREKHGIIFRDNQLNIIRSMTKKENGDYFAG